MLLQVTLLAIASPTLRLPAKFVVKKEMATILYYYCLDKIAIEKIRSLGHEGFMSIHRGVIDDNMKKIDY
jgi:hypothetical protein